MSTGRARLSWVERMMLGRRGMGDTYGFSVPAFAHAVAPLNVIEPPLLVFNVPSNVYVVLAVVRKLIPLLPIDLNLGSKVNQRFRI